MDKPEDRHAWTRSINSGLLKLEHAVFLAGYHKALVLCVGPCNFCDECVGTRADCKNPQSGRSAPEAMAVDVYATTRQRGCQIQALTDYSQPMDHFGLLLVEYATLRKEALSPSAGSLLAGQPITRAATKRTRCTGVVCETGGRREVSPKCGLWSLGDSNALACCNKRSLSMPNLHPPL